MKKNLMLVVLAVAILLAVGVSSAFADTATVNGVLVTGKLTATDTVTVKATVNPKLVLAVTTPAAAQTVDFGTSVDPGTVTATQPVSLAVWSNKTYDVTVTKGGSFTAMGLITTLGNSTTNAKTTVGENAAGHAFSDTYSLNVPWNSDPIAYTATVLYTVVQN
jgi:predicted ribosomally synthesized peptide with SipW-like signal peptide